ncbi:MAG: hypothetical protein JOZ45_15605 [Acidobacteriaceae bacterium]|nr:hypothetical protein [Acidobacteriaceae bacterium]
MEIHKKLVTDEQLQPVAVQIDYEDWLKIEQALALKQTPKVSDLNSYRGVLRLMEEPLEYQNRIRDEWS